MAFIKSNMILATMVFALVGTTLAISATIADSGPHHGAGFMAVSSLDLHSNH